jgi:hypothetical protein
LPTAKSRPAGIIAAGSPATGHPSWAGGRVMRTPLLR